MTIEARYGFLDRIPKTIFGAVARHLHGELEPRADATCVLREALLDGTVPEADHMRWPHEDLKRPVLDALAASKVAEVCAGDPELTDEIVRYMLDAIDESERLYERGLVALTEIACRNSAAGIGIPCRAGTGNAPVRKGGDGWRDLLGDAEWNAIRGDAMRLAAGLARDMIVHKTKADWAERADLLLELERCLRELGTAVGLPPGVARGVLRKLSRDDLLRLRNLLKELESLAELIRTLGRSRDTSDETAPTVLEQIRGSIRRKDERAIPEVDRGPIDLRGVERSGDFERMLPSEAALLRHPTLRKLWHARRIERSLATYHARGVLTQRIQTEEGWRDGMLEEHRRLERGPVIVILDTSGSMSGTRDRIAKAVALQLASTAFMEKRPCDVYNFSASGNLVEYELTFEGDGLVDVLAFLTLSFGGGTQPDEALRRAMTRLESDEWRLADLVMLSDGEFVIGTHISRRWAALKKRSDVRAHAIRVGRGTGFDELPFDELHDFGDFMCMLDRASYAR